MTDTNTIKLTPAASAVLSEIGQNNPAAIAGDVENIRKGLAQGLSPESLRTDYMEACLDGADEDRLEGWTDYVDAIMAAAQA